MTKSVTAGQQPNKNRCRRGGPPSQPRAGRPGAEMGQAPSARVPWQVLDQRGEHRNYTHRCLLPMACAAPGMPDAGSREATMDPALVVTHVVSAFPLGTLTAYGTPWPVGRHPSRLPVPDGIGRGL